MEKREINAEAQSVDGQRHLWIGNFEGGRCEAVLSGDGRSTVVKVEAEWGDPFDVVARVTSELASIGIPVWVSRRAVFLGREAA